MALAIASDTSIQPTTMPVAPLVLKQPHYLREVLPELGGGHVSQVWLVEAWRVYNQPCTPAATATVTTIAIAAAAAACVAMAPTAAAAVI
jgi:hypothetical protein